MNIKSFFKSKYTKQALGVVAVLCAGVFCSAYADGAVALSDITKSVGDSILELAKILTDVAIISGVGFVLASFFKFHQHKLNPTQVPISQGVTLLLIGSCLMLFVALLPMTTNAVLGGKGKASKIGGADMATLIGGQ